jgi:hypothetical protein
MSSNRWPKGTIQVVIHLLQKDIMDELKLGYHVPVTSVGLPFSSSFPKEKMMAQVPHYLPHIYKLIHRMVCLDEMCEKKGKECLCVKLTH